MQVSFVVSPGRETAAYMPCAPRHPAQGSVRKGEQVPINSPNKHWIWGRSAASAPGISAGQGIVHSATTALGSGGGLIYALAPTEQAPVRVSDVLRLDE